MTDQPLKNLAFELLGTNQTLKVLATILLEMQSPTSDPIRKLISDELRLIESRVDRLHSLTRPKNK